MLSKYKLFCKFHLLLLLIIFCNFKEIKTKHEKTPQRILPMKSNYERLKDTLSPVLARINRCARRALEYEDDYDYGTEDNPDEGDFPLDNAKSDDKSNKKSKSNSNYYIFQDYGNRKVLPFSNANEYCNKSHMVPRYYEIDYDSIGPDGTDDEKRTSPTLVYGRIESVKERNPVQSWLQQVRNAAESKRIESLYEKYKSTLGPLMKHFNASYNPPRNHSTATSLDLIEKNNRFSPRKHPTAAYNSLYDEFKKRLIDFSSDLGIKTGLSNVQSVKDMLIHDMRNKERNTNEEHITSEFQKAQNLAENLKKGNSNADSPSKSFESSIQRKRQNNYIRNKSALRCDERGNDFVDNDHNDHEDCFRPLPFFRKPEEEINSKKRTLRGVENDDQSYLSLNKNNPVLDGRAYNKFLTTVYADPMDKVLKNLTASNLLEKVAGQMNLSTLDVAKKVASIQGLDLSSLKDDPELHKILQEYIENSAAKSFGNPSARVSNSSGVNDEVKFSETPSQVAGIEDKHIESVKVNTNLQNTDLTKTKNAEEALNVTEPKDDTALTNDQFGVPKLPLIQSQPGLSTEQVADILKKLTKKLEEIQFEKVLDTCQPLEDLPCILTGSWQSKVMGLRFDVTMTDLDNQSSLPVEARNRDLNVTIRECTPPRPHDVIELNWPITGSTLSEKGGPFFFYTQKRTENLLATFVGYCRNCGGTDTIFGTWCISFPSKNCQDTTASFQTKNDILRRYKLEEKRVERYNERFRKSRKH